MSTEHDIFIPQDIWNLVIGVLGEEKGKLWFFTSNPMLGDIEPIRMIALGRTKRLRKAVNAMLEENK